MIADPRVCRMKRQYPFNRQGAVLSHSELWFEDHCSFLRKKRQEASGRWGGGTNFTSRVPRHPLHHTSVGRKMPPP